MSEIKDGYTDMSGRTLRKRPISDGGSVWEHSVGGVTNVDLCSFPGIDGDEVTLADAIKFLQALQKRYGSKAKLKLDAGYSNIDASLLISKRSKR